MPSFPTNIGELRRLANLWTTSSPAPEPIKDDPLDVKRQQIHVGSAGPESTSRVPATGHTNGQSGPADELNDRPVHSNSESAESIHTTRRGSQSQTRGNIPSTDLGNNSSQGKGRNASRFRRHPFDTYVIVRPPSTTAKNPLNLQIQLVVRRSGRQRARPTTSGDKEGPPSSSSPAGLEGPVPLSLDAGIDESDEASRGRKTGDPPASGLLERDYEQTRPLSRTGSLKSTSSVESGSSSLLNGGRRRVEPMFNLTVHNVVHYTTITDAATDAKVAKFLKRCVDIMGVGTLEPTEVWSTNTQHNPGLHGEGRVLSRPPKEGDADPEVATSTLVDANQRTSETQDAKESLDIRRNAHRHSLDLSSLRVDRWAEGDTGKKFFGKLMARVSKEGRKQAAREYDGSLRPRSPIPQGDRLSRQSSRSSRVSHAQGLHPSQATSDSRSGGVELASSSGLPTFGTSPSMIYRPNAPILVQAGGAVDGLYGPTRQIPSSAPHHQAYLVQSSSRPLGYSWTFRKWSKTALARMDAQGSAAGHHGLAPRIDNPELRIVFEWTRLRLSSMYLDPEVLKILATVGAQPSIVGPGPAASLDNQAAGEPSTAIDHDVGEQATSPILGKVIPGAARAKSGMDDNETEATSAHSTDTDDSDPEDSETPWVCSVQVGENGHRVFLATLTPAPHHPKIIGSLKLPIELEPMSLDAGDEHGHVKATADWNPTSRILLTEENLKDVVCATALWLVAREEFGGLGRKRS